MKQFYRLEDTFSDGNFLSRQFIESNNQYMKGSVFVYGHPIDNFIDILPDNARVITFLREPRDQVISGYLQVVTDEGHPLHQAAVERDLKSFSEA